MRRLLILLFLICGILSNLSAQNANGPIGQWREQYNNKTIVHVLKGDKIYGASNNQVFSIDSKKNIDLLGKSNGLNELGIAALAWDDLHHQLIIAYNNSNISTHATTTLMPIELLTVQWHVRILLLLLRICVTIEIV